jgi:CheY-like chemotaxis protein
LITPLSLTALLVDDDEAVGLEYKTRLENIDMGLRRHTSNEEAIRVLESICSLRLPLHVVLTDIMRPNGPDGLKFVEHVRNASYGITVGGGLRLRYLPLIVISDHAVRYRENVKRIDGAIPVHEKPIWSDRLVQIIVDSLAEYRAKLLSELQHVGIAVTWKDGTYQVLPAYGARQTKLIETDRFVGDPAVLAANYTALCLLNERGAIARFYLAGVYKISASFRASCSCAMALQAMTGMT